MRPRSTRPYPLSWWSASSHRRVRHVLVNSIGGCSGSAVTSPRKLKREKRLFRLNVPTTTCTLLYDRLKQAGTTLARRMVQRRSLGYVGATDGSKLNQGRAARRGERRCEVDGLRSFR